MPEEICDSIHILCMAKKVRSKGPEGLSGLARSRRLMDDEGRPILAGLPQELGMAEVDRMGKVRRGQERPNRRARDRPGGPQSGLAAQKRRGRAGSGMTEKDLAEMNR